MALIFTPTCSLIVFWVLHFYGKKTFAYNLETRKYTRIKPNESGRPIHFGTTLALKRLGGTSTLYAGAPFFRESDDSNTAKNGIVYECPLNPASSDKDEQSCSSRISFERNGAMGLSMDLDSSGTSLVVCGNQYTYVCGQGDNKTLSMIGSCYEHHLDENTSELFMTPCQAACPFSLVADIVFALDESGSVVLDDFIRQRDWVITLLRSFRSDIDSGNVQVGIVVFSSNSRTPVDLRRSNFTMLEAEISNLTRRKGGTDIVSAIRACRSVLKGSVRRNIGQQMIILTDGESYGNIRGEANQARSDGVTTVAVGVGPSPQDSTLSDIAGNAARVFRATDFSNLDKVTEGLRTVIRESAVVLEGQTTNAVSNNLTQCQEGSSTHISAKQNLYIGAAGAYDRSGSVVEHKKKRSSRYFSSEFNSFTNEDDLKRFISATNLFDFKESYLGYSVTTGKFLNADIELVASGAPRYKSKGGVLIYSQQEEYMPPPFSSILHPTVDQFWQLGAYFGHSVLGLDINKDRLDDLLVSAPLFSDGASAYDNGRVFIFTNNRSAPGIKGWMTQGYRPKVLKGSNSVGSRFGMSIVIGGDLDRNGYDDIIISAPGEENSRTESGAVYIYFVTSDGIIESSKQKILGKNVAKNLRGFGGGILRGSGNVNDLDGNQYPDAVISAPYSDDVFVLYSRPIVSITSSVTTNPTNIDMVQCALQPNQTCSSFTFCISARQRISASQNSFDMDFLIELDPLVSDNANKRMLFLGKTVSTESFSSSVTSSDTCKNYEVALNMDAIHSFSNDDGAYTPLRVQVFYDFTQSHQNQTLSAVLDPLSNKSSSSEWYFQTGCSDENQLCLYDLKAEFTAEYLSPQTSVPSDDFSQPFVLGATPGVLEINVTVANVGLDFVLSARMNVFSGLLLLSKVRGDCARIISSSEGFAQLSFKVHKAAILGEHFTTGRECNFVLSYPLQSLLKYANSSEIFVQGNVYSNTGEGFGSDQNLNNNNFSFSHQVRYSVDLSLTQPGNPSNIFYNYSTGQTFAQTLNDDILGGSNTDISHSYMIVNSGPHILSTSSMTFQWPTSLTSRKASPVLYLHDFQCNPSSICKCDIEGKINYFNLPSAIKSQTNISLIFPPPFSVNFSQQTTCDDVYCDTITCSLNNLSPFESATVMAMFKLWLPTLSQPKLSTAMSSYLQVHTPETLLGGTQFQYDSSASTTVTQFVAPESIPQSRVAIWVIIVSIIAGIVLIAIVVAALWKAKFFSSKYAEMTKAAQGQAEGSAAVPESNATAQTGIDNPVLEN